ncbi:MAG: hypothetical protein JWP99_1025, partial [Devosia sp.]|nr:hypothetical protein [Devosia sp.]
KNTAQVDFGVFHHLPHTGINAPMAPRACLTHSNV